MNIYGRAINEWGISAQLDMVTEECAELIKAINKYKRGKGTKEELIEECVDVELMLNQMKEYFKLDVDLWWEIRRRKIKYLAELLGVENNG